MGKDDRKKAPPPPPGPFHNPFAALAGKLGPLPSGPAPSDAAPPLDSRGPARAVVRLERKGRRGKEVTVVEGLGLPSAALESWLKALKGSLGCGGSVEDGNLVLQGDHRERLPALLSGLSSKRPG